MDPARDNPLIRFIPCLRGTGTFMMFALLLAVIWFFNRKAPATIEDVVAVPRYATKAEITRAQAAGLPQEMIDAAMPAVAEQLAAAKPVAVEKPEQVVPGSPAAAKLAPPKPATAAADGTPAPMDPAVKDADKPQVPAQEQPQP